MPGKSKKTKTNSRKKFIISLIVGIISMVFTLSVGLEAWTLYVIFPQALIVSLIIDLIVVILSLIFNIISYKKYKKEVIAGLILSIESICLLLLFSPLIVNCLNDIYWEDKTIYKIGKEASESLFKKNIKKASQYAYRKNGRLPNSYDEIKEFISNSSLSYCKKITLSSTKNKIKYKGKGCTGYEYQGTIKGEIPLEAIKNVSGKKLTIYAYKSDSDFYIYSTKKTSQGSAYKLAGQHSFRCISTSCNLGTIVGPTLAQVNDGFYKYIYDYKGGKMIYQLDESSNAAEYIINKNNQETGIVLKNKYGQYGYYDINSQKTIDLKYNFIHKGTSDGKYIIASEKDSVSLLDASNGKKVISNANEISCATNLCKILTKNSSGESVSKAYSTTKRKYTLTDYDNIYDIQEDRIIAEKDGKMYELNNKYKIVKEYSTELVEFIHADLYHDLSGVKVIDSEDDLNKKIPKLNSKKKMKDYSMIITNERSLLSLENYSDIANCSSEDLVKLLMVYIYEPYYPCYNKKFIKEKIYELYDVNIDDIQESEKITVIGDYYCGYPGGGSDPSELVSQKEYEESNLYVYEYKFEYPNFINANSSGFIVTVKFKKVGDLYKLVSITRTEQ